MKKKVVIFGCGVGGLSVAHELSKNPIYDITMYEKKYEIGGLARSSRDANGCATEYCWRVYFKFYDNVFKIMSEIPLLENNNESVLDNLTGCSNTCVADKEFTFRDKIKSFYNVFYGLTSSDARLDELDNLSWWKSLDNTNSSHLLRAIGPWLGADRFSCSYKSVIKVGFELDILPSFLNNNVRNYISTKPTSEAWFNHWKIHLEDKGVKINFGTELDSIDIVNNKINYATVRDKSKFDKYNVTADYYVFALPVEVLDVFVRKTPGLQYGQFLNIPKLKDISLHMQLSFQLYFDRSISLGIKPDRGENNSFLLIDSPWDIIVLQYDKIYTTSLCKSIPNAKGGWSVAACTAYIPGIVFGKPLNKCRYEEIIVELWTQMYTSKELQRIIKEKNGYYMEPFMVVKWSPMWPSYRFDEYTQSLKTTEPKFTNNAGTYALRPSFKTHIDNLFISTAYIKETIDIFSMEAAAISGKYVANAISGCPGPIMRKRPAIFEPFRSVDSVLYQHNLPNIGLGVVIVIIIFIIILIVIIFKRPFN